MERAVGPVRWPTGGSHSFSSYGCATQIDWVQASDLERNPHVQPLPAPHAAQTVARCAVNDLTKKKGTDVGRDGDAGRRMSVPSGEGRKNKDDQHDPDDLPTPRHSPFIGLTVVNMGPSPPRQALLVPGRWPHVPLGRNQRRDGLRDRNGKVRELWVAASLEHPEPDVGHRSGGTPGHWISSHRVWRRRRRPTYGFTGGPADAASPLPMEVVVSAADRTVSPSRASASRMTGGLVTAASKSTRTRAAMDDTFSSMVLTRCTPGSARNASSSCATFP